MREAFDFLLELGYSEQDIDAYVESNYEGILSELADYSYNVSENMKYVWDDFDRELLLFLTTSYCEAFVMSPEVFRERFELLKAEFPYEYDAIIENQYWGDEGDEFEASLKDSVPSESYYRAFLEVMPWGLRQTQEAIESLKNPSARLYRFICRLNEEYGIPVSTEDVPEDQLLELERCKFEVFQNAEYLTDQGMPEEIIISILAHCPNIMTEATFQLQDTLVACFGDDYIEVMKRKATEDALEDILSDLCD